MASVLLNSDRTCLEWGVRRGVGDISQRTAGYLESNSADSSRLIGLDNIEFEQIFEEQLVDVIVDFSCADALDIYADVACQYSVDIVSAFSDYPQARIQQLQEIAEHCRGICSPNITVGINFLMIAAKILQEIAPQADIEIVEEHFVRPEPLRSAWVTSMRTSSALQDTWPADGCVLHQTDAEVVTNSTVKTVPTAFAGASALWSRQKVECGGCVPFSLCEALRG